MPRVIGQGGRLGNTSPVRFRLTSGMTYLTGRGGRMRRHFTVLGYSYTLSLFRVIFMEVILRLQTATSVLLLQASIESSSLILERIWVS